MPWIINVLTMFPNLFPGPLNESVMGRSLKQNLWNLKESYVTPFANFSYEILMTWKLGMQRFRHCLGNLFCVGSFVNPNLNPVRGFTATSRSFQTINVSYEKYANGVT